MKQLKLSLINEALKDLEVGDRYTLLNPGLIPGELVAVQKIPPVAPYKTSYLALYVYVDGERCLQKYENAASSALEAVCKALRKGGVIICLTE